MDRRAMCVNIVGPNDDHEVGDQFRWAAMYVTGNRMLDYLVYTAVLQVGFSSNNPLLDCRNRMSRIFYYWWRMLAISNQ